MHKVSAGKIWEYMKRGKSFLIEGNYYTAIYDEDSEIWKLCVEATSIKGDESSLVHLVVDMDISNFDKMCDKISIEEYFLRGCEISLKESSRKKY